jgi:hypothetical protein
MKLLLMAVLAFGATDRTVFVTQTACQSLDGGSLETAKNELLVAARRSAVEQLFASQLTSLTEIEDLDFQKDQIQAATVGFVRQKGDPVFFNGQGLGELCVTIEAYIRDEDRAAFDRSLLALAKTLRQARPRRVIEADLDQLGLGGRIVAAVVANSPKALEGVRCAWSVEPADVLRIPAPNGACRVEVAMPDAPLLNRGATILARIVVRVERQGQLLDELTVRGEVRNALFVEPVTSASVLAPGATIAVSIVLRGRPAPLPPGYNCSWSFQGLPLAFTFATENGCQGHLVFKPEDAWSPLEGVTYARGLQSRLPVSLSVGLLYNGSPVSGGSTAVEFAYRDSRDPDELIRSFSLRFSKQSGAVGGSGAEDVDDFEIADIDAELSAVGLPPLSDANEKTLELRLNFESGRGKLATHYVGAQPVSLTGPLDRYSGLLDVLYSLDGKDFASQGSTVGLKTLKDLARVDHLWIKLGPPGSLTGPFRLSFDFQRAVRTGLEASWRALHDKERRRIGCEGFVVGGESDSILSQHRFLPILDEVAVGRGPGGLWRSRRYDSRIEHLFDRKFERVEPPVRPTSYTARLTFTNGRREEFSCTRTGYSRLREGGLYVRLERSTKTDVAPEEIEVYLVQEPSAGWIVWFYDPDGGGDLRSFKPALVRVSTDGGATFRTIEQNYQNQGSVKFAESVRKVLVLRFVNAAGEVEYRGKVDFAADRRAAEKGERGA